MSAVAPARRGADYRIAPHRRRKLINQIALTLSLMAMAFGLMWLIWILWETLALGLKGLSFASFTESTPPPNAEGGGLANAIVGSLIMVFAATAVGTPVGILAGIYLAEYGQRTWLGHVTRFINDILLSAPSIVIGLFVYAIIVAKTRTFSGYAGVIALALIVVPVVVRTTENMLQLIPNALREAAVALGSPKWVMIWRVTLITGTLNFIVQNMPGARAMIAANYVYGVGKPDGLAFAGIRARPYFDPLVRHKQVQFDWRKFTWLGSPSQPHQMIDIRATSPYKTIYEVRKAAEPPKCGASGTASTGHHLPLGVFAPLRKMIRFRILVVFCFANVSRFVVYIE